MKVSVFRKERFNAAHRLFNPKWDDAANLRVFGKCSYPNYHGHNYDLIVEVCGEIDPETGFVYDLGILSNIIKEEVVERYDHRNLNLDLEEFKTLIPTAENIAVVIWNRLRKRLEAHLELRIRLYETERNFVEYNGN